MVAMRDYAAGEAIFKNESLIFPGHASLIVVLNGERVWIENLVHTINRGGGNREFYLFDSFQNHSCDPNTVMRYFPGSATQYELVAKNAVVAGEELTSDYETVNTNTKKKSSFFLNRVPCLSHLFLRV